MTKEQIGGIVRTIAASALGYAAGKGIIDSSLVNELAGAIGILAVGIWSIVSKKQA